jgi:uncharacterized protein
MTQKGNTHDAGASPADSLPSPGPLAPKKNRPGPEGMRGFMIRLRTLAVGTIGGYCGYRLGIPLGWLLGAMIATIPLSIAGVDMRSFRKPRLVMIAVIGLMVGSAFTPEVAARIPDWWPSLLGVLLYVVIVALVSIAVCWRLGAMTPATAAFAGMPGGLSEMVIIGPAMGADVRSVSLVHGTRLVVLIAMTPTLLAVFGLIGSGAGDGVSRAIQWFPSISLVDVALLSACAVIGFLIAKKIRLPAGNLTGPLILSALVHVTGITDAHIPDALLAAAQIVIGSVIGQHFAGIARRVLLIGLLLGALLTVFSMALAGCFAFAFEQLLGVPFAIGLLSLVPGGLPEMSLIAITLDADPAFVSLHHLARVVLILITAPVLIPLWVRRLEKRRIARG